MENAGEKVERANFPRQECDLDLHSGTHLKSSGRVGPEALCPTPGEQIGEIQDGQILGLVYRHI